MFGFLVFLFGFIGVGFWKLLSPLAGLGGEGFRVLGFRVWGLGLAVRAAGAFVGRVYL